MHIVIKEITTSPTRKHIRYEVSTSEGVLIPSARDPEHEAARLLYERGYRGRLSTSWHGSTTIAMRGDIEKMARLTTRDNAHNPPHTVKHAKMPMKVDTQEPKT